MRGGGGGGGPSKNFVLPLQRKMGELFEQMRRISFFSWFVCFFKKE